LLSYAEVADGNSKFVLKEQGVVISAYDSTPSLYEEMCISKASTALSGTHGMLLYGNLNPDKEYYVRSYASYEYNGNIYTLYSDVETSYPSLTTF